MLKIDIHTHIIPDNLPNFTKKFGYEGFVRLDKKTFVFLRWIANIGQFLTVNFVYFFLDFQFSFVECLFFIFLGFLSNFYLQKYLTVL